MCLEVAFLPSGTDTVSSSSVLSHDSTRLSFVCSVVTGLRRTVTENPEALGLLKSFLSEAGYTRRQVLGLCCYCAPATKWD